jgi:hypothetical protein
MSRAASPIQAQRYIVSNAAVDEFEDEASA